MSSEQKHTTLKACAGCGVYAPQHPMIAVMKEEDVRSGVEKSAPGPYGFVAVSVCKTCHENPEHRAFPIKGHFFYADQRDVAVRLAGSNVIGS